MLTQNKQRGKATSKHHPSRDNKPSSQHLITSDHPIISSSHKIKASNNSNSSSNNASKQRHTVNQIFYQPLPPTTPAYTIIMFTRQVAKQAMRSSRSVAKTVTLKVSARTMSSAAVAFSNWSQTYSYASPESDSLGYYIPSPPCTRMPPLPKSLHQAMQINEAPLVILTAQDPHYIVHVNTAFEDLYEYTSSESVYQTLELVMADSAANGSHASTWEANHVCQTKSGKTFTSHVRTGPLESDESNEALLVCILKPVHPRDV
jgi:hypothetical protein